MLLFIIYFINYHAICCTLYALVQSSIPNLGHTRSYFHHKSKFSFILVLTRRWSLLANLSHYATCLMLHDRALLWKRRIIKTHSKIIRSSYLPLLRGSPCERDVTLAHFALTIRPHPYLVVVPYWLLHGSPTLNQIGIFLSKKKYQSVSFLSSEARIFLSAWL